MVVYELEFDYFCGVSWEYETVKIIAKTKKQMKEAFLESTKYISGKNSETEEEAQERVWNRVKKDIIKKDLKFPIINNKFD